MTDYKEVSTTQYEPGHEGRVASFKATQLIWLLLGILEAALGLRFIFKLVGVNAANPFASFLYAVTNLFVAPFASLTGAPAAGRMVFEFSTLIAMIIYVLLAWALERIIYVIFYRPRGESVSVKQTTVSDHAPAPTNVSKTTVTEHTNSQSSSDTY